SKAPYYYGELIKKDSNSTSVSVPNSSAIYLSSSSNGSNNIATSGSAVTTGTTSALPQLDNVENHNSLHDLSPSTSVNSLSRPASGRVPATLNSHSHYGISTNLSRLHHNSNTIGSFANPLLSIEPDTHNGSESLPRAFQTHTKKFFPNKG